MDQKQKKKTNKRRNIEKRKDRESHITKGSLTGYIALNNSTKRCDTAMESVRVFLEQNRTDLFFQNIEPNRTEKILNRTESKLITSYRIY